MRRLPDGNIQLEVGDRIEVNGMRGRLYGWAPNRSGLIVQLDRDVKLMRKRLEIIGYREIESLHCLEDE